MCEGKSEDFEVAERKSLANDGKNRSENVMHSTRPIIISQSQLDAVASTVEALCTSIDDIEDEIKRTQLVQSSVQTKLENFSKEITTLCDLVNGPDGLVAKTVLLEAMVKNQDDQRKSDKADTKADRSHLVASVAAAVSILALVGSIFFQVPACKAVFAPPPQEQKE